MIDKLIFTFFAGALVFLCSGAIAELFSRDWAIVLLIIGSASALAMVALMLFDVWSSRGFWASKR